MGLTILQKRGAKVAILISPAAAIALRYAGVAIATYAATRAIPKMRRDQPSEDALDQIEEGLSLRRDNEQVNAAWRHRRAIRLGRDGPGVEVDMTSLVRLKFRRLS